MFFIKITVILTGKIMTPNKLCHTIHQCKKLLKRYLLFVERRLHKKVLFCFKLNHTKSAKQKLFSYLS